MTMSNKDINPYDWYRSLFSSRGIFGGFFDNIFREFDEMSRTFSEQFKNIENKVPKDLIKEYQTPDGGKVREVGPIVYGYSMTIGPDGKPKVREFGNVKSHGGRGGVKTTIDGSRTNTQISAEREPLVDVNSTD